MKVAVPRPGRRPSQRPSLAVDTRTENLLRAIKAAPTDERLVQEVRAHLRGLGQLRNLAKVLAWWADKLPDARRSAAALVEAGNILANELAAPEEALARYFAALARDPSLMQAYAPARALCEELGHYEELVELMGQEAEQHASPRAKARVLRELADIQSRTLRTIAPAIATLERALALTPDDLEILERLAHLLSYGDGSGPRSPHRIDRALELHLRLAQLERDERAIDRLISNLRLRPDHLPSLELLEELARVFHRERDLLDCWEAYIERASDSPTARARRLSLARAYAQRQLGHDVMQVLAPLLARGDAEAMRIAEPFEHALSKPTSRPPSDRPEPSVLAQLDAFDCSDDDAPTSTGTVSSEWLDQQVDMLFPAPGAEIDESYEDEPTELPTKLRPQLDPLDFVPTIVRPPTARTVVPPRASRRPEPSAPYLLDSQDIDDAELDGTHDLESGAADLSHPNITGEPDSVVTRRGRPMPTPVSAAPPPLPRREASVTVSPEAFEAAIAATWPESVASPAPALPVGQEPDVRAWLEPAMAPKTKREAKRRQLRVALWFGDDMIAERTFKKRKLVTLGYTDLDALPLPSGITDAPRLPVLKPTREGGYEVQLHPSMGGSVWLRGTRHSLDSLRGTGPVVLGPTDHGVLLLGHVAIAFQLVARAPRAWSGWPSMLRAPLLLLAVLLSAGAHGYGVFRMIEIGRATPRPDTTALSPELIRRMTVEPPPPPEPPPQPEPERPRERRLAERREREPRPEVRRELPRMLRERLRDIDRQRPAHPSAARLASALTTSAVGNSATVAETMTAMQAAGSVATTGAQALGTTLAGIPATEVAIDRTGSRNVNTASGAAAIEGDAGRLEARTDRNTAVRGRVSSVSALSRVEGSLSRGEVQQVINRHQGRIQACYERALARRPDLGGRVTFAWTIAANGRVQGASEQGSTLGDPGVSNCILGVLRGMRFPRPSGGSVRVSFPFMFQRAP